MFFKITYRNDIGVYESIVSAESEFEALLMVKKENPIDGKFDVKEVIEVSGSGILSSKTIKTFKRPQEQSFNPGSAYEHFLKEKESNSYNKYVADLRKLMNEL